MSSGANVIIAARAIVSGEVEAAKKMLRASPQLAKERAVYGATRQTAGENFYKEILHYIYEGDTALHMAAAAYQEQIVTELIARGVDVRAKNRRGQQAEILRLLREHGAM